MAVDRRTDAYTGATALDQAMLDETFVGGETDIHTVGELSKTVILNRNVLVPEPATPCAITLTNHGFSLDDAFTFGTTGALPAPLMAGQTYYAIPLTVDTFNFALVPGGVALNTGGGAPSGTHHIAFERTYLLRFSDRAKFVGDYYYEGRARFPDIKRTVGELVAPTIQFSEMSVELNNVDGFYNQYLEGGDNYFSPVGARLVIKVGLREVEGTYFVMFDGTVPDDDGFSVERQTLTVRARDKADALNRGNGLPVINLTDFPSAPQESLGKVIPFVLGDWESGYNVTLATGTVSITNAGTQFNVVTDSPANFTGGVIGYPVGGGFFVFSIGSYTPDAIAKCHIKRGQSLIQVNFAANALNGAGYWVVQVLSYKVAGGGTIAYQFQDGDVVTLAVKVPYSAGKYSNPIELAEQILITLGGLVAGDFDAASWTALKTKATPAQSNMTSIKMRVWIGEADDKILEYTLQHLEQVRVELYWNNSQKVALRSLHPEDFPSQGSFRMEQIYLNEDSMKVESDQRNFFNQALANYSFTPVLNKTQLQTGKRKNQGSIDKTGKEVLKAIDLPSIYLEADALLQLDEFIRFYSTGHAYVTVAAAWPTLLRDLTEIVMFNYLEGSIEYDNKPMKVRDITFNPSPASLVFRLLSLANFPYTGNAPANSSQMLSSADQEILDV